MAGTECHAPRADACSLTGRAGSADCDRRAAVKRDNWQNSEREKLTAKTKSLSIREHEKEKLRLKRCI